MEELMQRRIERRMNDAGFAPGYHTYVEFGKPSNTFLEMADRLSRIQEKSVVIGELLEKSLDDAAERINGREPGKAGG